ncbi:hypothetical protein SAMN02800694_1026 [Luteibacter sp. UNCMF331Sha3.1]|uniref:hypothetical protein n=1 Tax=Luteibacter sp. UNCMF331Sha3.1 TaxID=1502760 RepID=UPI0008CF10C2|nr:hypothetical protein [Luteibacter sp. UNCMF331Sha3.1]SEM42290.1 hypothetical protein SAMN02800694_1026 [Luteibacter sp. UNCMF331Sha3.1]
MTFFRSKSVSEELLGRAHRIAGAATGHHPREAFGAAREYAGRAGLMASDAFVGAGRGVRRHPVLSLAVGIGIGAAVTAVLLARRRAQAIDEHDEHDPTRQRPTNSSGDALDGSGEDNPVPGETGLY